MISDRLTPVYEFVIVLLRRGEMWIGRVIFPKFRNFFGLGFLWYGE
jgi:hypothetical protein